MTDNLTNIYYKGEVKVKLKINGKQYEVETHNEGLNYLMYIFSVFLTGNYPGGSIGIPQYVDLRRKEYGSEDELTFLKFFSQITAKKYYSSGNDWIAEFTTVINSEQLIETINVDDTATYTLYLMTGYDENNPNERQHDLARLLVSPNVLSQITPGITATLVWSMKLVNYEKE